MTTYHNKMIGLMLAILLHVLPQMVSIACGVDFGSYTGIGNGAVTADNPRAINRGNIPGDDWEAFWKAQQPLVDAGIKHYDLWMPFGQDPPVRSQPYLYSASDKYSTFDTTLRVEQYSRCKASGKYPKLIESWGATKAFIEADKSREVCCYLGAIIGAPEWDANYESAESLCKRLDAELEPYIDAGCSLAFDATGFLAEKHWFFGYVQTLKARGVKIYIEAWPVYGLDHLTGEHSIALSQQLVNYTPTTIGKPGGFLDPTAITGRKHAWIVSHVNKGFPTGYAAWCKQIIPAMAADTSLKVDSITFYVKHYLDDGGKLEDLKINPTEWQRYIEK